MDGQVSAKGDVYSFGVVLLETFTGKKPTDTMFEGNLNLHQWVTKAFPDAVMDVLDPNIRNDVFFRREEDTARINKKPIQIEGLLVSIFHVALQCLKESPEERINMRNVVAQLKKIRNQLRASSNNATYTSYKPLLS
ncbi:hypothetical protein ACH5RR_011699 [Cinchona calisaya]|uniref:Protein kinase domain-containing protein n=1 Tax=Cinchona calisaya TaxID=153742 RepID=A0ABD3ABJ3_9GENT